MGRTLDRVANAVKAEAFDDFTSVEQAKVVVHFLRRLNIIQNMFEPTVEIGRNFVSLVWSKQFHELQVRITYPGKVDWVLVETLQCTRGLRDPYVMKGFSSASQNNYEALFPPVVLEAMFGSAP